MRKVLSLKGLCAASSLLCSLPLSAQTGAEASSPLDVQVGDSYEYEGITRSEIEITIPMLDSTQTTANEAGSLTMIEVNEVTDDEIIWDMTTVTNISNNAGGGGRQVPIMMTMRTDRQGKLKKMSFGEGEGTMPGGELLSMLMNGSNRAAQGPGWFMPENLTARKVGGSWEEPSRDTIATSIMGSLAIDLVVSTNMVYTYEGRVDTLGVTAARISWVIEKMTIDGSFDMSEREMNMTMSGKGKGSGVAYYSLEDKLLLAQRNEIKMDQKMEIEDMGTMSMKMKISTDQSRQD